MHVKVFLCLVYFSLSLNARCQPKLYDYSNPIHCDDINSGINDPNLYKIIEGRFFVREDYDKNSIYKVTVENGNSYYISKELKDKISQTLLREKCKNVIIEKNPENKGLKIVRD